MKTLLITVTFYPMWKFEIPRLREDHKRIEFNCSECPNNKPQYKHIYLNNSVTTPLIIK